MTTHGEKDLLLEQGGSAVPPVTHSVMNSKGGKESLLSFNHDFTNCEITTTPVRGELLGIVRPVWRKVVDSECRLAWLHEMVKENLFVRDIENYAKSLSECLRSEEMIYREEERKVLSGLMKIKLKDERKHLEVVKKVKEVARGWLKKIVGKSRKYQ